MISSNWNGEDFTKEKSSVYIPYAKTHRKMAMISIDYTLSTQKICSSVCKGFTPHLPQSELCQFIF